MLVDIQILVDVGVGIQIQGDVAMLRLYIIYMYHFLLVFLSPHRP